MTEKKLPKWLVDGIQGFDKLTQRYLIDMTYRLNWLKDPRKAFETDVKFMKKSHGRVIKITDHCDENGRILERCYHFTDDWAAHIMVGRTFFANDPKGLPYEPLVSETYNIHTDELTKSVA